MRTLWLCGAAMLLPALLVAQDAPDEQPPARVVRDGLKAELQQMVSAYRAAMDKVRKSDAYKQAEGDSEARDELMRAVERPDTAAVVKKGLAKAEQYEGDERCLLLCWVAASGRDKTLVRDVVARIEKHHIKSPVLGELMENARAVSRALGRKRSAAFLQKIVTDSPHDVTRAWAMYWMARSLGGRRASEQDKLMASKLLADAEKLAKGTPLADRIAGPRFQRERLQIGMVAPDIAGEDIDGVKFKLTDYRGKVVVLDFWGFW